MKNLFKNRIFLTFFISIFIFLSIFSLRVLFYSIDDNIKSFSIKFKNYTYFSDNSKNAINKDLVFVTIDEKTLDSLGFPMPRWEYVKVIENLNQAEIIAFDIIFANENKLDKSGDDKLAEAIKKSGNIVLGWWIIQKNIDWVDRVVVEKPLEKFYSWALAFGYYKPEIDLKTNRVFSFYPASNIYDSSWEKSRYNHFSISLLKAYYSRVYKKDYLSFEKSSEKSYFLKPDYKIPFSSPWKRDILINFIPKPSPEENKISKFPSYSFLDVYNSKIDPEVFKWKIVLIWATSKWIKDIFTTTNGIEYWVFVLWNIINTILTKNYLVNFSPNLEWFLIFMLLLLSVYFNLSRSGFVLIFSNLSISIIFLFIFPVIVLFYTNYLLWAIFELFLALIFSLAIWNIVKYLIENKNKIKLTKALSEYVSKAITNEILSSSWNINLNWESKQLSIFFSDIEWFTSVSEKFTAKKLVSFLREYLWEMSNIILNNQWFINKYEWDAIMALWWTFKDYENSSYLACDSALKQQKLLKELNKSWSSRDFPEIKVRIWLHFWEAIVWNIWAEWRKLEYTALWDNVNLASRLEWVNKFYGTYICVSEVVYNKNKEKFIFRYLDEIRVKWKENSVKIYELVDYKENIKEDLKNKIDKFEEAIKLYKEKKFSEAKIVFKELLNLWDKPSSTYIERCDYYSKNPPSKDWDSVWNYTEK